jgi:beta-glucosidase/6-phospho-beta-glucosidase/beta-galactosidase
LYSTQGTGDVDHLRSLQQSIILVIENGVAARPGERKRARYLRDHIRELQRAHRDGVNVIGYLAWSLTTNREWGLPSGPDADFGLYHIDLDGDPALTRRPTPAALAYAALVRHRRAGGRLRHGLG